MQHTENMFVKYDDILTIYILMDIISNITIIEW